MFSNMKSDISRIRFALHLAEIDLVTLSTEDWPKLLMQLRNFLQGKAPEENLREVHNLDFHDWKEKEVSRSLLAPIQGSVRYMLTSVAAENWRIGHGSIPPWGVLPLVVPDEVGATAVLNPSTRTVEKFPVHVDIEKGRVVYDLLPGDFRSYLIYSNIKEAFLFGLQQSLGRVDVSYLRHCPACPRIFFADHGRQEHCSSRCAERGRKRRLRAATEQKAAKEALKKRQRKKDGSGVPEPPSFLSITGPFKRPRSRQKG